MSGDSDFEPHELAALAVISIIFLEVISPPWTTWEMGMSKSLSGMYKWHFMFERYYGNW